MSDASTEGTAPVYGPPNNPNPTVPGVSFIPTGLSFDDATEAELNAIVSEYKGGTLSMARAIGQLGQILNNEDDSEEEVEAADSALEAFVSMLISHEKNLERANERGRTRQPHNVPGPDDDDECGDRPPSPQLALVGLGNGKRRQQSPELDSPTENQLAGASNKKRRIYETDQPWYLREFIAQSTLSPSLVRTREILCGFSADYPAIKRWISNSASVPDIPDSEWDSIIRGRSVNLDVILSGLNTISSVTENTEELGSLQIRFGVAQPAKTVKTHGEWVICWTAASDATCFCFPHRVEELRAYGNYITRFFAAVSVGTHSRIINFDKAVRHRVGQRNDLSLTDFAEFADLKMGWIDSYGTVPGHVTGHTR